MRKYLLYIDGQINREYDNEDAATAGASYLLARYPENHSVKVMTIKVEGTTHYNLKIA